MMLSTDGSRFVVYLRNNRSIEPDVVYSGEFGKLHSCPIRKIELKCIQFFKVRRQVYTLNSIIVCYDPCRRIAFPNDCFQAQLTTYGNVMRFDST